MGNTASSGSAFESALPLPPFTAGHSAHTGIVGSIIAINGANVSVGTNNSSQVNIFADPASVLANFRRCVLGIDTSCGGVGNLRGLNPWNVDATIFKEVKFTETVGATLHVPFTKLPNHFHPTPPTSLSL